jgi:hypothetical protein
MPDGLARAYADYRAGARRRFQQAQQDGAAMSGPACDPGLREPCADEHEPRTYITEVSVPDPGDGGIQRLHSRMLEPEPEARAEAGR